METCVFYFFYINFCVIYSISYLIVNDSTINLLPKESKTANYYANSYFLQMIKQNRTSIEKLFTSSIIESVVF